jgi:hypothetical protein
MFLTAMLPTPLGPMLAAASEGTAARLLRHAGALLP